MAVAIMSLTVRDAKTASSARVRNTQTVSTYVNLAGRTLAELEGWWGAFATYVDACTDGIIEGGSITIMPALPGGLQAEPVAGSDVQEGGLLTFQLTGSAYTEAMRIPAFDTDLFGADGADIPDAGAVGVLVNLMEGSDVTHTFPATDRYGTTLASFVAGRKSFRK